MRVYLAMIILGVVLALVTPLEAGDRGRPTRLETPANVTCTRAGDQVTVTWDKVADAAGYQGMAEADEGQELKKNVVEPPWIFAPSVITNDPDTPILVKVMSLDASRSRRGDSKRSAEVNCTAAAPAQLPAR